MMSEEYLANPYTELQVLPGHRDIVRLVLAVGNGWCVTAADDGAAFVWDCETGVCIYRFQSHQRPVTALLLFPDAYKEGSTDLPRLLTAASDKKIIMWDLGQGCKIKEVNEICGSVKSLAGVDNQLLVSGGERLDLWNSELALLHTAQADEFPEDIHILLALPNQQVAAATGKQILVYSVNGEKKLSLKKTLHPGHGDAVKSMKIISEKLFTSGSLDGSIIIWSCDSLSEVRKVVTPDILMEDKKLFPLSVQYLQPFNQKYLLAAIGCGFCLYDIDSGSIIVHKTKAHPTKVLQAGFVHNGHLIVTCAEDGSIHLWWPKIIGPLTIAPTNNMTWFSRGQSKPAYMLHRQVDVQLVGELLAHTGYVQGFVVLNDHVLVSCGADHIVLVWRNKLYGTWRRNLMYQKIFTNR